MKIHVVALVMVGMTEEAAGGTDAKSGGKEIPFKSSNSIMQMHILIRNSNMCRKGVDSSATVKETCANTQRNVTLGSLYVCTKI